MHYYCRIVISLYQLILDIRTHINISIIYPNKSYNLLFILYCNIRYIVKVNIKTIRI